MLPCYTKVECRNFFPVKMCSIILNELITVCLELHWKLSVCVCVCNINICLMRLKSYLFVCMFVCLSVCLSTCISVHVQVHRGVTSRLSVKAAETSVWFQCVATNKLDTDTGQTEFYISGACVCVCVHVCVFVCVVKWLQVCICFVDVTQFTRSADCRDWEIYHKLKEHKICLNL